MKKFNLDDHQKRNIFDVPDRYFEELAQKIEERKYEDTGKGRHIRLNTAQKAMLVAAAVTLLILWGSGAFFENHLPTQSPAEESLSFENLGKEEIKQYLLTEEWESSELVDFVSENETGFSVSPAENMEISPELLDQMMDLEELEEYL